MLAFKQPVAATCRQMARYTVSRPLPEKLAYLSRASSVLGLRHYTPVRSRVPYPPRPGRNTKRSSSYEEQFANNEYQAEEFNEPFHGAQAVPNPGGILQSSDAVVELLSHPTLVIERRLEMMNVFLGFEQANHYTISDIDGNVLGYMEEEDFGITKAIMRQVYRLHRPFRVKVMDREGNHVLTIRRPFSFINSHIKAILPSNNPANEIVIGETKQQWHPWRRRYNLFLQADNDVYDQFGRVDAPFLSFAFPVHDDMGNVLGAVDRNWVGLGRELFTDTGVYILRMDPSAFAGMAEIYPNLAGPLTLDQRAIMLGTAVSIDFDYFSRHSNRGGLLSFHDYE